MHIEGEEAKPPAVSDPWTSAVAEIVTAGPTALTGGGREGEDGKLKHRLQPIDNSVSNQALNAQGLFIYTLLVYINI